jgi:hypothetical protein
MSDSLPPIEVFLGVPYAAPPLGSLRFMPPVTPSHWRGVRMANKMTPSCPQKIPKHVKDLSKGREEYLQRMKPFLDNASEDCLYLNVYVPYDRGESLFSHSYQFKFQCAYISSLYNVNCLFKDRCDQSVATDLEFHQLLWNVSCMPLITPLHLSFTAVMLHLPHAA